MSSLEQLRLQDHPILQPFRLNGRWYLPADNTIALYPTQTAFLLMNGKIGKPAQLPAQQKAKGQQS
ncbi:hypothetical protein [Photobacterium angustum]|uniref:hypothetical protein n=1 Tax=Photobacterium angustum TaxID=661 RepID=UPI0005DE7100|nr:hypothetical protein [Photobacterium angustum]KJF95188.1 hypothetical protein UB39_07465 [Photobacterium angustum]PSW81119.1 hypothetical protein CTN03_08400 [Photobacterium angustum]